METLPLIGSCTCFFRPVQPNSVTKNWSTKAMVCTDVRNVTRSFQTINGG